MSKKKVRDEGLWREMQNPAAVALGKLGGKVGGKSKSKKKAAASRRNGKLGGRPKVKP